MRKIHFLFVCLFQRWTPFNGFRSSNLLPTDRRAWSDEHGDIYLPKESIRLPSAHWNWEGDWFIDENLQGEICTDRGVCKYFSCTRSCETMIEGFVFLS